LADDRVGPHHLAVVEADAGDTARRPVLRRIVSTGDAVAEVDPALVAAAAMPLGMACMPPSGK
jgi:hypothetical protein